MSVLEISRVERRERTYDLAALFPELDGPFTTADIALLPPRSAPNGATTWATVGVTAGVATVLLAGPDADSSGAVVVTGSADLWIRVTDGSETDAAKAGRITLLGGGTVIAPGPVPPVLTVQGRTGAVVLDADDVGADAAGAATAAQAAAILYASTADAGKQDKSSLAADTAAHVADGSALDVALRAALVPKWKTSTAYASGEIVLSPAGRIVQAKANFTSGASYNAANWTDVGDTANVMLPPAQGGGLDDGPMLNAFIAATAPGACIRGRTAGYNIATTVQLLGGRTYDFGGSAYIFGATGEPTAEPITGALFRQADGANLDYVVATSTVMGTGASPSGNAGIIVRGLLIDGNAAGQTGGAGHGFGVASWSSHYNDLAIINTRGHGIHMPKANQGGNTFTSGNRYENLFDGKIKIAYTGGHGIFVDTPWTDGTISGQVIINGTRLSGITILNGPGWHITGGHLWNVGTDGIVVNQGYATHIHHNYIEGFGDINTAPTSLAPWTYSTYAAGTTYSRWSVVLSSGVLYYSLQDGNTGHTPSSAPTWWAPINVLGGAAVYGIACASIGDQRPVIVDHNSVSVGHVSIPPIGSPIVYRCFLLQSSSGPGASKAIFDHNHAQNENTQGQTATAMAYRVQVQAGGTLAAAGLAVAGAPATNSIVGTFSQASVVDAGVTAAATV